MITKAEKFWDKQAERFKNSESQSDAINKDIIARTRKHLNINDTVLDFGCATGTQTIDLAGGVKHIHGLDFSSEMIRYALLKKEESNIVNVSFSIGTLTDDSFEKSPFDKVVAGDILHLLADSEKVICRIHELLKPGGIFISITACMKDKMTLSKRLEVTAEGRDANISPAYSPDGRVITFRVTNEAYRRDQQKMKQTYNEKEGDKRPVWVMNTDGSNVRIAEVLHYQCAMDGSRAEIRNLR